MHDFFCPEPTANARDTEESQFFSQNEIYHVTEFSVFFCSSVLVFSETHDYNRSPCLNVRSVAQIQRQIPEKLKNVSFSSNEMYHATEFSEVVIFKCSFSVLHDFIRSSSVRN